MLSLVFGKLTKGLEPGYRVLEVGCGTGNVLRFLSRSCQGGSVVGIDLFREGLQYARQRTSCDLVQGDIRTSPFSVTFQIVGMFDVLEHIPDDVAALRTVRELIHPRGALVLTVPAHGSLWSYFDEAARHCRRYETTELRRKLEESGYVVEYLSECMASIYPLLWARRRLAGLFAGKRGPEQEDVRLLVSKELRIVPFVNGLLTWVLSAEAGWTARGWSLPAGTSLLAIARRRPE